MILQELSVCLGGFQFQPRIRGTAATRLTPSCPGDCPDKCLWKMFTVALSLSSTFRGALFGLVATVRHHELCLGAAFQTMLLSQTVLILHPTQVFVTLPMNLKADLREDQEVNRCLLNVHRCHRNSGTDPLGIKTRIHHTEQLPADSVTLLARKMGDSPASIAALPRC